MAYTQAQLQTLYATVIGDASRAGHDKHVDIMAAIAMAESGGEAAVTHKNTDGTTDYGLWQINSRHFGESARIKSRQSGSFVNVKIQGPPAIFDPYVNASYAAAVYKAQGYAAWATYTTTDPKRSYKRFLSGAPSAENPLSWPQTRAIGGAVQNAVSGATWLQPLTTWATQVAKVAGVGIVAVLAVVIGAVILLRKPAEKAAGAAAKAALL